MGTGDYGWKDWRDAAETAGNGDYQQLSSTTTGTQQPMPQMRYTQKSDPDRYGSYLKGDIEPLGEQTLQDVIDQEVRRLNEH